MLVLSRKVGETIEIDGQIKIQIVKLNGNRVRVGIEAPNDVHILRGELGEWSAPCLVESLECRDSLEPAIAP